MYGEDDVILVVGGCEDVFISTVVDVENPTQKRQSIRS